MHYSSLDSATKVSEVTVASIFTVEDKRQQVSKYIMVNKSLYPYLMYNVDLYVHDMCHVVYHGTCRANTDPRGK
jgi:hypothetical protein